MVHVISEEYRPRRTRFLGLWEPAGWTLKVYGIAHDELPSTRLLAAAKRVAEERLATSAVGQTHYGVGFLGIHAAKTANFVFVDWWADENELHHHLYVSALDTPELLEYKTPTGVSACVWELQVIAHEGEAWVQHVLSRPEQPDFQGYLAQTLAIEPISAMPA
jgi:hypothetical protein